MPPIQPQYRNIIKSFVKTAGIGVVFACTGAFVWKKFVHDEEMKTIDNFYKK